MEGVDFQFPRWTEDRNYIKIDDIETLKQVLQDVPPDLPIALDTETTGLDRLTAKLLGYSFSYEDGTTYWVPIHTGEEFKPLADFIADRLCIFYNANYDIPILERHGINVGRFEDALCMVYLENPNAHMRGLKEASKTMLGREMVELKSFFSGKKPQVNFELLDYDTACTYACMDADCTLALWHKLQHIKKLYPKIWGIEMALVRGTMEMELEGIDLDLDLMRHLSEKFGTILEDTKQRIYKLAGHEFNTNAPMQVGKVLFEELGLPCKTLTPTGRPSTGKIPLGLLVGRHEIVKLLLEVGSLQTKLSSFIDALPKKIHPKTGRIHCSFRQWNTSTGRYSSTGPNLQNIPKAKQADKDAGLIIRDAFVANPTHEANDNPGPDDWVFVDGDYSQIELRVATSLSREPTWVNAYLTGQDVHIDTAKKMNKTENPTPDQRVKAKTANFSMLNGQSGYAFAMKMDMTPEEGDEFVQKWFAALPVLSKWMESERQHSRNTMAAHTLWGRRRTMGVGEHDSINCFDHKKRAHWERNVCSHIIQGTAADIMKLAIVMVRRAIIKAGLRDEIKILLTVHDQLVFKVRKRVLDQAIPLIRDAMEIKIAGWVPLLFDIAVGTRWGSCKDIERPPTEG